MKLKHFILALVAMLSCFTFTANAQVAKVGETKYATIDEAIANWTNGTTLTLLADVTLSDVIKLSSTEYHILDLGTYTMTAASSSKKYPIIGTVTTYYDAIQIVNNGRSSASYALDIKADATNPGGITASGKAVVKTTGKSGVQDRPVIRFYGGVFNGSNIVSHSGSNGTNCPQFWFYGGEFNGTISANRAKFCFYGGTFNGSLSISVDSSADALVSGGKFKSLSNSYGSTLNTDKFTIGSAAGVYDRGIYVDKDGYYVITSAPIIKVSAKYPAVKKESYNSNNYFYYSAAATYGMFYEVASMAGTGSNVTIWTKPAVTIPETLTGSVVEEIKNNTALEGYTPENLPTGAELEIELKSVGETIVYDVTPMANGAEVEPTEAITFRLPVPASVTTTHAKVLHEGESMGIYEIKGEGNAKYVEISSADFSEFAVVPTTPVAKIGDAAYATLAEAVEAAQAGDEIVVIADIADVTVDVTKNLTISGAATLNNVAINANGADALTVKGLTFTGNSWINSGTAEALTVSGITATVAPNNTSYTNSRSAFISLGRSEGQELALTVENSNITVKAAGVDAILGWAKITAAIITGNVIKGSKDGYFTNADAIKFMAIADGAKFVVNNNEIYSNYNGIVFAQNTTRDNAYSVSADANKFYGSNADHIWIEITGGNTVHATFNATSANTVNGNAFTVTDIKYRSGVIKSWSSYAGVDVVTDSNGKVIGGTLASFSNAESVAEGYEIGTNGAVGKASVAEVNGTKYASFAEAAANAQADSEIKLLANIDGDITVPANVTLNGNGFAVSGVITADGTITFAGVTKAGNFGVKNVNTVVNIPAGASLQLTGTSRMVIGHGCTFNITGTIANAKTANVADVKPSLIMPGASFTGAGVTFNVTNAYISAPSSYCSSSKSASGTFDFNITNSIWESAGKLAFEEQSVNAKVDFALVNSVLTTGSHLVFGTASGEEGVVIDNSYVNKGTSRQLENRSTMTIKNGSVVNGAVATSSNAINPGTIIVENATYAVTGEFSGAAEGTGTLIIKKGATVSVGSIKAGANVKVDAEGMTAADEINFTADLSKFTGTLSVINNDKLEAKIVDGKVVLAAKPVAKIGEIGFTAVADAIKAAQAGETVTILAGNYTTNIDVNKAVTVQGATDAEGNNLVNITGNVSVNTGATVKNLNVHNDATGDYACALDVNGKDIVLDGVNLSGYNAMRYCYATGNITIMNSTLTSRNFTVHFDGKAGGNVSFENCDITGWCSYASTIGTVSYANSTIAQGSFAGHRYFNKNISFTECDFAEGFKVELKASGTTVAFTDADMTMADAEALFKDPYYVANGNITVNGTKVAYEASGYVNGASTYGKLQDIINGISSGNYITLRSDNVHTEPIVIPAGKKVEIGGLDKFKLEGTITLEAGAILDLDSSTVPEGLTVTTDVAGNKVVYDGNTYKVESYAVKVTYPAGNPVYAEGKVEYYDDMLEAVPYTTNCPRLEGATITLLKDVAAAGLRFMENDMVFDLNGHTYTITAGTGSQGTNTSGFQIRPEVTTKVIFKNGTINVAEGAPVCWMFNCYATQFIVENVTVDCANMAWSYGSSCLVVVSRAEDDVQLLGTTEIKNFNAEVAGDAYSVGGTMTVAESAIVPGTFKLGVGAVLTAPAGLEVKPADGYKVVYADGVYTSVATRAEVATKAELNAALANADIETIVMTADIDYGTDQLAITKAITLDLNGKTVSGTCNKGQSSLVYVENNAALTVKDSSEPSTGKLTFAQGSSDVGWTVDVKGAFTLESGTIELTGSWSIGYAVDVRPNSWGTEYTKASVFTMNGGSIVSTDGGVRVASSSAAEHKAVAASFVMNGGLIDAAWDGVFVQQSDAIYDVLSFTMNGGAIKSALNPVRVYGPAATGYVKDQNCMSINFNGGEMTYTGTDAQTWAIEGILRVGGGSSLETVLASGNITASEAFAENHALAESLAEGYLLAKKDGMCVVGQLPDAEVVDLGLVTVGPDADVEPYKVDSYHVYDLIGGSGLSEGTESFDLQIAMNFKAKDTEEEARANAFADYTTDFFIQMTGMSGESFVADGCYLAGYYPSFEAWVKIPLDGFTVEKDAVYPVITSAGFDFKYTDICGSVKDFICGIYLTPEVLAANPGLNVKLSLGLSENMDAALDGTFTEVDSYTYDAEALMPAVAEVAGVGYKTLAKAIAAAEGDATITMLADVALTEGVTVPAGKTITLDLNGKTISANIAEQLTKSFAAITNKGTLTIKNGTITLSYDGDSFGYGVGLYTISNEGGTLNIVDAIIENTTTVSGSMYDAIDNNSTLGNTVLNISGGKVVCGQYIGVRQFANSTTYENIVNVTGGEVVGGNTSIWMQNPGSKQPKATIAISGDAKIEGRLLAGTSTGFVFAVTGGTFTTDVTSFCAKGYLCQANDNGTYSVVDDPSYEAVLNLVDGEFTDYNYGGVTVGKLTYQRTIPTTWTSFYVPFEVDVKQLAKQGFEVAYINGVRRDDTNYDGELDEFVMEIIYIHSQEEDKVDGSSKTLKANYPYFIRSYGNESIGLNIVLENAKLYAATDATYDCTTMTERFELIGNLSKVTIKASDDTALRYVVSGGKWSKRIEDSELNPFRFSMKLTSRKDSDPTIDAPAMMSIAIRGEQREDGTTLIYDVEMDEVESVDYIFDLQGRRVLEPQKGNLYIINGKKVIF